MDYCMDVIKNLREQHRIEIDAEQRKFYLTLWFQVEDYMCHLLDQVQYILGFYLVSSINLLHNFFE